MDTTEYAKRLTTEKEKLETELQSIGRRNPSNPNDWEPIPPEGVETEPDPNDAADYSEEFDVNASIVADLETRYNEVLTALARIADGTYGVCEVSNEPIEKARLDADPAAKTCVNHMR